MKQIPVEVREKVAIVPKELELVCGNSDYSLVVDFDDDWAEEEKKTARFIYVRAGKRLYEEVEFTGNIVAVPALFGIRQVLVGFYAGDLHTTTPVVIRCQFSILCGGGTKALPSTEAARLRAKIDALTQEVKNTAQRVQEVASLAAIHPDLAQNDPTKPDYIKGRTHYTESVLVDAPLQLTFDGDITGKTTVPFNNGVNEGVMVKVSDVILTYEEINTKDATYTLSDGTTKKLYTQAQINGVGVPMVGTYEIIYSYSEEYDLNGHTVAPGTYLYYEEGEPYPTEVYFPSVFRPVLQPAIHTIPEAAMRVGGDVLLTAPNGIMYRLSVDNTGALTTVPVI